MIVSLSLYFFFIKKKKLFPYDFFSNNDHPNLSFVLGQKDEKILLSKENAVALVLGEPLSGKTSCLAIPSILQLDKANVVAVCCQNELAEYTSGYRKKRGPVFYFNWALKDDPLKNEFYPRWNPLSDKEMPKKGKQREEYLFGLAHYCIMCYDKTELSQDEYWEKLAVRALSGLLCFFAEKVERASANDYFLSLLLEKNRLTKEDKDLLLSYYVILDQEYAAPAINNLETAQLNINNYLPIGSWEGISKEWQGKELSFSMFSDWLLKCFLSVKSQENDAFDKWKMVLEACLQEAELFGYDRKIISILQQIFYLSHKQRSVIFPMILKPLNAFRLSSVRERTSTSDFCISQSRGIHSVHEDTLFPVTVYSVSSGKNCNFIAKLFVDMLLDFSTSCPFQQDKMLPIAFVFDDLEQQMHYETLTRTLKNSKSQHISVLMNSVSISFLQHKYSLEELEDIINFSEYKILLTDDTQKAANEFKNLSFSNEGSSTKIFESSLYLRLSKKWSNVRKSMLQQGDELILTPYLQSLPVLAHTLYFLNSKIYKSKAMLSEQYFVADKLIQNRNSQDLDVPDLLTVLKSCGFDIQREEDIDLFLENRYEKSIEMREQVADKKSVLADDISNRWKNLPEKENSDWWMSEDAFDFSDVKENSNPFQKKQ